MSDADGNTDIADYTRVFDINGADAVWALITSRCLSQHEQEDELDRLEAEGWSVLRHYSSQHGDHVLDAVALAPPGR
ncbi:hypothetical protein [Ancylobacter defluvii]|uniref:Uncharacterized protein n=1 Tax=Ancylobacter defluvii TaxID=1282440 RepID=A0A9W6JZB1_9HYPH|nr:hypothetical protein [Ancylobacter defluvii]MBS7588275.1 hypothetical protein [Ancylobacter defluvii]GLK86671.1 hypothetical protein GCM10017653_47410 [Ancylobacter defluvii]